MKRISLGKDPLTGIENFHSYDPDTNITYIEAVQDVEPIIERNKALANTEHGQIGRKQCWWHAASIPNVVIAQWLKEGVNFYDKEHWPAVKRKLNSPEYRYLRTGSGKL